MGLRGRVRGADMRPVKSLRAGDHVLYADKVEGIVVQVMRLDTGEVLISTDVAGREWGDSRVMSAKAPVQVIP